VLWLLVDVFAARERIRRYAASRGVDPNRIIFAARTTHEDHLARHTCADLFLDTAPYGAHTTASDALRVGLPVVTLAGCAFQGRVAASLLHALNLDELICDSTDDYKSLAMGLATESAALRRIRNKLLDNRSNGNLFVPAVHCRYLESAFVHMHKMRRLNRKPQPFAVTREHRISVRCSNDGI
jgi:predicted O-linked N-acetylglucosamine transferase (SPINDLY family)